MKIRSLIIALAITAASGVLASDKTKDSKEKTTTPPDARKTTSDKDKVLVTGSYIKQDVRRSGRITDGSSQVVVLDQETIERTGAGDLKQLLIHQRIR